MGDIPSSAGPWSFADMEDGTLLHATIKRGNISVRLRLRLVPSEARDLADCSYGHLTLTAPDPHLDPKLVALEGNLPFPKLQAVPKQDWTKTVALFAKTHRFPLFSCTKCITIKGAFLPSTLRPLAPLFRTLEMLRIVPVHGQYVCWAPFSAINLVVWVPEHDRGIERMTTDPMPPEGEGEEYPSALPACTHRIVINMEGRGVHATEAFTFLRDTVLPNEGAGKSIVVVADELTPRQLTYDVPRGVTLLQEAAKIRTLAPKAEFVIVGLWELRHLDWKERSWGFNAGIMVGARGHDADSEPLWTAKYHRSDCAAAAAQECISRNRFLFRTPEQYAKAVGVRIDRLTCLRDPGDEKAVKDRAERLAGPVFPCYDVLESDVQRPADDFFEAVSEQMPEIMRAIDEARPECPSSGSSKGEGDVSWSGDGDDEAPSPTAGTPPPDTDV